MIRLAEFIEQQYADVIAEGGAWTGEKTFDLLVLVMIFSGVTGFIYEEIFYLIDLGRLVKRGSTYGPYIPIYMFGGLAILLLTCRFRTNPLVIFLLGVLTSGALEYATGAVLYECFHVRLWDYNTEIWNWGNINGYVCARSVLLFGFAGVFLVCMVAPLLIRLIGMVPRRLMHTLCMVFLCAWILDMCVWQIRHKIK